jgi:hypothetical protein
VHIKHEFNPKQTAKQLSCSSVSSNFSVQNKCQHLKSPANRGDTNKSHDPESSPTCHYSCSCSRSSQDPDYISSVKSFPGNQIRDRFATSINFLLSFLLPKCMCTYKTKEILEFHPSNKIIYICATIY